MRRKSRGVYECVTMYYLSRTQFIAEPGAVASVNRVILSVGAVIDNAVIRSMLCMYVCTYVLE